MRLHVVPLLAWSSTALAATVDDWRSRSIYQVMTDRYGRSDRSTTWSCDPGLGKYCGGSWQGIIDNLDYIQNMGFTAIWISPITANLPQYTKDLGSYHGYWQQNLYALNDNFGSVDDLKNLSRALHDRKMYLMVDVVVNNFAWAGDPTSVQYDRLIPFSNASYYHTYCPLTATSSTTECWLGDSIVSNPDLRTEDADVRSIFNTWISTLVSTYNIDGLRIDSAGNVETSFFPPFSQAASVFCTGEVYTGVAQYVCPLQDFLDSILNYPVYFPLVRAFASNIGSMNDLVDSIKQVMSTCKDPTALGIFSENHDQPRFAHYTSDLVLAKNVLAFTMLADGIPIIYQGQEQHLTGAFNPVNREAIWLTKYNNATALYGYVTGLNVFRQRVIAVANSYLNYRSNIIYNDTNTLAMRKGANGSQVISIFTNIGSQGSSRTLTLAGDQTGFAAGTLVTEIISCTNMTIGSDGSLSMDMKGGLPKVFYAAANIIGTTICVNGVTLNPNPVSLNPSSATRMALGAGQLVGLAFAIAICLFVTI